MASCALGWASARAVAMARVESVEILAGWLGNANLMTANAMARAKSSATLLVGLGVPRARQSLAVMVPPVHPTK
eukprot:190138-Alexandrium_andersonii.AAC.1